MTENNGFNSPENRDEETQMLENPVLVTRVRQDLQASLTPPEGGFRSRRAEIMNQIRAEAAQNRPAAPTQGFIGEPEKPTQQFRLPQDTPTQQFTVRPDNSAQRFNDQQDEPTQRFNVPPVEPVQRFTAPQEQGEPTQRFTAPPSFVAPAPVNFQSRLERRRGGVSGWMGALAAALVVLVIAGVVFTYLANNNKGNSTVVSQTTEFTSATNAASAARTTVAATSAPPAVASAPLATPGASSGSSGGQADASTKAAATTSAAGNASSAVGAAATTRAAATTAAATTAAATTVAATTAAATTAASDTSIVVPGTPAPVVTSGPGGTARATGLPPFPGSTPINNLGSGKPIQFIIESNAAKALPNPSDQLAQGLDKATVDQYKFSGSKLSGLHGDDVVAFYEEKATAAGYKIEGITPLIQDKGDGNKMRWIYLSRGTERVGILVVDSNDAETGSTFGLNNNETGIYFATT